MQVILVTGSTGFIGKRLVSGLSFLGVDLLLPVRAASPGSVRSIVMGDFGSDTDWSDVFSTYHVDCVVHLAGVSHKSKKGEEGSFEERCFRVNCGATVNLAKQAAKHNVKKFIFISSVGVNGTSSDTPFSYDDIPDPRDAYSKSKLLAEKKVRSICDQSDMNYVIIRPPMVYGPEAPGIFSALLRLMSMPLPMLSLKVDNRRSYIFVDNLVDFIIKCIFSESADNGVFLVSDGFDLLSCLVFSVFIRVFLVVVVLILIMLKNR